MHLTNGQIGYILVFFVYGLSFFAMGIALTLEAWRSTSLAERRVLRPLAIFGLMHGMHEWMEIVMLQGIWLNAPFPQQLTWFRVSWLAASFVPLVYFGVMSLNGKYRKLNMLVGFVLLCIFLILVFFQPRIDPGLAPQRVDALARYILAVPGGEVAAVALFMSSRRVKSTHDAKLSRALLWTAVGFAVYGLTQVFVSPISMFPASVINSSVFMEIFGFPVQVVRAGMALLITVNLLLAIKIVGEEREAQLVSAKQARLEALERLQQETVAREAMRKELLQHTVIAQEDERARIARELHDESAQLLTAISLNLATLQMSLPDRADTDELAKRLQDQAKQLSQGIYRLVHDLRPAQLDDLGLIPALLYLADQNHQRMNLDTAVHVEGKRRRLSPLIETVIFRVAQEALTNVGRHAQVNRAEIRINYGPREVTIQIKDAGIGFDPHQELIPPHGWGLAGMRERVDAVGGVFIINSTPGKGTCIEVRVPLNVKSVEARRDDHGESDPVDIG